MIWSVQRITTSLLLILDSFGVRSTIFLKYNLFIVCLPCEMIGYGICLFDIGLKLFQPTNRRSQQVRYSTTATILVTDVLVYFSIIMEIFHLYAKGL